MFYKLCAAALTAVIFTSLSVHAAAQVITPMQADGLATARQRAMVRLYLNTRRCMVDGSSAMLRSGARDAAHIVAFAVTTCSGQLHRELTVNGGFPAQDADAILRDMALLSLREAAGLPLN